MILASFALVAAAQAVTEPVVRSEYLQQMDAQFRGLDLDGDGNVSAAEMVNQAQAQARAQALAENRQLFVQLDTDRNGYVDANEFAAMAANARAQVDPGAEMAKLDLDRDGLITLVEHRTVMLQGFDRIDMDKDGVVTPGEMNSFTAQAAATPGGR